MLRISEQLARWRVDMSTGSRMEQKLEAVVEQGARTLCQPRPKDQAPGGDSTLNNAPDLSGAARSLGGGEEDATGRHRAEQLQDQHRSEQQQLNREQLDQLRAFKTQLLQEVLTHLSPSHHRNQGRHTQPASPLAAQLSLSLNEAGQLLSSPATCTPTRRIPVPPSLATPTNPPITVPESPLSPLPSPPCSTAAPTLASEASRLRESQSPDNSLSTPSLQSSVASQHVPQLLQAQFEERLDQYASSTPSPALSMEFPQLPAPSLVYSIPPFAATTPSNTHPPSIPLPPTHTPSPYQTSPALVSSQNQQKPLLADTPSTLHHSSPHTASSHVDSSPLLSRETMKPAVKAALIEKHARHMEDLKRHYESQLDELRTSLAQDSETTSVKTPTHDSMSSLRGAVQSSFASQYGSPSSSPALQEGRGVEYGKLQAENARLKSKCADLQTKLEQCNMVKQTLEDQVEKQQQYWLEWQDQAESTVEIIGVLQDRLEASRTQLQQQDSIVEQLQADLQASVREIEFWKEQRAEEAEKSKRLCGELEELQKEHKSLQAAQTSLRVELSEAHRERGQMEASLRGYRTQEQDYKSTIQKLEEKARHLQHVNNRLHGQATHYSLGSSLPNTPDEDKLRRHSPSPSHSPKAHTSPLTATPSRPTFTGTTHPHTHTPTENSKSVPLNRRKWLQPSDPGLIFGTPPAASYGSPRSSQGTSALRPSHSSHSPPPHSHSSHSPPPHSHGGRHAHLQIPSMMSSEMMSSPLLQSTGQTISRQLSESGSSNEGEDPIVATSLMRRGYVNADSDNGGEDPSSSTRGSSTAELSQVDSLLSAIQHGKIQTGERSQTAKQKEKKESIQERVQQSLQVVAEAEKRLAELQKEKKQLESILQRAPKQGGRVTRHSKQTQLETECRLEAVEREIGSVRMTLRNHHALGK